MTQASEAGEKAAATHALVALKRFRASGGALAAVRWIGALALAALALSTPGFLSAPSLLSLATTVSFVGCVAMGMTLITISGNILSLSLGATVGASAMIFVVAMNAGGPAFGLVAALAFGAAVNALQGAIIGYVRANPIIVSIAAFALISGGAEAFAQRGAVFLDNRSAAAAMHFQIAFIPSEFIVFLLITALCEFVLRGTVFGRHVYMLGSSFRAAEAAGVRSWRVVAGVYCGAGLCAGVSGALLAIRYGTADMTYGVGYDYDAVAAVLVGGTLMRGGHGSPLRTLFGAVFVAVVEIILILRGFRDEWQYLISGLIVSFAVLLQPRPGDAR